MEENLPIQPPITPQPAQTPSQPAQTTKNPNKIKLLGWILTFLAVVFIGLVVISIILNFALRQNKTQSVTKTPTPAPAVTPQTSTPLPIPTPAESRFNITP